MHSWESTQWVRERIRNKKYKWVDASELQSPSDVSFQKCCPARIVFQIHSKCCPTSPPWTHLDNIWQLQEGLSSSDCSQSNCDSSPGWCWCPQNLKVLILVLSSDTYPSKRNSKVQKNTWAKNLPDNFETRLYLIFIHL